MMIAIYPAVPNVFLDTSTFYIVIIVNPTNKTLIFNKGMYLSSIHKCIDTLYIIIDIAKAFTAVVITFIAVFEPFTAIQKAVMLGSRYQRTSLASVPFENGIFTISVEFIFILKVEAILIAKHATRFDSNPKSIPCVNNLLKPASSIFVNDIIYAIIANAI